MNEKITEPTEEGFYRYSGGRQTMLFLLDWRRQWWVFFDNGSLSRCGWGYIEQALGVYKLIKIESDEENQMVDQVQHYRLKPFDITAMQLVVTEDGDNADDILAFRGTGMIVRQITLNRSKVFIENVSSRFSYRLHPSQWLIHNPHFKHVPMGLGDLSEEWIIYEDEQFRNIFELDEENQNG